MSMNLDWRKCQTGNIIAPLPDIPGYPYGGPFRFFSHLVTLIRPGWDRRDVKTVWTFDISLHVKTGGTAHLTNDDFTIPDTETADEMRQALERLTPEDFARALKAHGYKPDKK